MRIAKIGVVMAMTWILFGCATRQNFASNPSIVTRMAARETGCEESQIVVTELEQHFTGHSRYQTEGCGIVHNYVCRKWDNILMASLGTITLDPRPCAQEKR